MSKEWDRRRLGGEEEADTEDRVWRPRGKFGGRSTSSQVYGDAPVWEARPVQRRLRVVGADDREPNQRDQQLREAAIFGGTQPYVDERGESPVQRRASTAGSTDDADVHRAAAAGVATGAGPLPHLERIQEAFGGHDVTTVKAHVGGPAADAAEAIGAEAYATGDRVAFEGPPDLHIAAHEAAHAVQQRAGVQLKGDVGEAGDRYEQQADAVADAVVRGESAEALLGPVRGGRGVAGVQRKPATDATAGKPAGKFASKKGTVSIESIDFVFEVKAEIQAKDSHEIDQDLIDEVSGVESKLNGFAQSVAMAFVSGKEQVGSFPGVSIQLEGGLGELSLDRAGPNAKLGTIGIGFKGSADELLRDELRGRVSLQVSGTLSTTAIDLRAVLDKVANLDKRFVKLDSLRAQLETARLERDDLNARTARVKRTAIRVNETRLRFDGMSREEHLEFWEREISLKRELSQLREERKLSDRHLYQLLSQIEAEATAIDLERGRLSKALAGVRGKAQQKLGAMLVSLAAKTWGRILLKLIPIIGWAMAIADIADGAELVYDIVSALVRANWSWDGGQHGGDGSETETHSPGTEGSDPDAIGSHHEGGEAGEGEAYQGEVDGKIGDAAEGAEDSGQAGPGGRVSRDTGKSRGEGSKARGDTPAGRDGEGSLTPGDADRAWPEDRATIDPDRQPGEPDRVGGEQAPNGAGTASSIDVGKQVPEERATIGGDRGPSRGRSSGKSAKSGRKPAPKTGRENGKAVGGTKDDGQGGGKDKDRSDTLIALSTAQANRLVLWNGADAAIDPTAEGEWVGRQVKTTDGRTAVIDGLSVFVPALANVAGKDTPAIIKYQVTFDLTIDGRQTEDRHTLYTSLPTGGQGRGQHLETSNGDLKQKIVAELQFSKDALGPKSSEPADLGSMVARIEAVYNVEVQTIREKTYYTFTVKLRPTEVRTNNLHLPTVDGDGETWQLVQKDKLLDLRFTVAR